MNNSFSLRFNALLAENNISQKTVAEALAVSKAAVNKWTKGGAIDHANLQRLAEFLQVDIVWLQHGSLAKDSVDDGVGQRYSSSLIRAEERLAIAQFDADIVTWEWDITSDTVSYSDNVEKVYGFKIIGNDDFWPFLDRSQTDFLKDHYAQIIRAGGSHRLDLKLHLPSGETRWLSSRATGIKNVNGVVKKIYGIAEINTESVMLREESKALTLAVETVLNRELLPVALLTKTATVLAESESFGQFLASLDSAAVEGLLRLVAQELATCNGELRYFSFLLSGVRRLFSIEHFDGAGELLLLRVDTQRKI